LAQRGKGSESVIRQPSQDALFNNSSLDSAGNEYKMSKVDPISSNKKTVVEMPLDDEMQRLEQEE